MHRLVPEFILRHWAAGERRGSLTAACLFVDATGFSAMTDSLMAHGQAGAEALAAVMRSAFAPLISAVFEFDGFVATHGGDSFMALFSPDGDTDDHLGRALAAALVIQSRAAGQPVFTTPYGKTTVTTEIGLSAGEIRWGIVESTEGRRAAFYFAGEAIDGAVAAEQESRPGDIILNRALREPLGERVEAAQAGEHYRLVSANGALPLPHAFDLTPPDEARMVPFFPGVALDERLSGEFRQVTHVFISLPGIRSEAQLDGFMQIVFFLLDRYGGLLKLQFGDKGVHLLVTWGAPVAYENDITRALSFVLDLQTETALPINAGVTHRLALAGLMGSELSGEYAVFGRGASLAARFMTTAPRGEVWLDEHVARRAESEFEIEPVGQRSFKGFSQPELVYRLVERKDVIETFYRGVLAGRDTELKVLADFVGPIWSGKSPGMLAVWGEAGSGKSRLVHEFLLRLEKQERRSFRSFTAQSDEILRESLNPFRYWLKNYFGISEGMAEARNKRSFNRVVDDLIAATLDARLADELDRTRSFLGALVGLSWPDSLYEQLDAQARYDNTFLALSALIQAESLRQPVILFVEDVHWLDTDSQAFLVRLQGILGGESAPARPVAVLMTGRQEPDVLPDGLAAAELMLAALSRAQLQPLAESQLGGPVSPAVVDLLLSRAEGNPFFAEQILVYLREQGQLLKADGEWRLTDSGLLPLPDGLQALLIARLDRLARDIRETVQTAAVLGREFEVRLLSEMLRGRRVDELVAVAERQAIWNALSELKYLFRHTLLRDAAYQMQVSSRRRSLHALAVQALEALYGDDLAPRSGELAYHAEQAGLEEKARAYLRLAAETARDTYRNAYAVEYYTRLLALLPAASRAERWDAVAARETILAASSKLDERLVDVSLLQQLAEELDDDARRADSAYRLGDILMLQGRTDEAIAVGERAIALSRRAGRADIEGMAEILLGGLDMRRGEYVPARQRYATALELAHSLGNRLLEAKVLGVDGLAAGMQGNHVHARACHESAVAISKEISDERQLAKALNNLAVTIGAQGDLPGALELYYEAEELTRTLGEISGHAIVLQNIGWMSAQLGQYSDANERFAQALSLFREARELPDQESVWVNMAIAAEASGKHEEAEGFLGEALPLARKIGNRLMEAYALTCQAYNLAALGRLVEAQAAAEQALDLRRALGNRTLILETMAALCHVRLEAGDREGALALAEEILDALGGPDLPHRSALNGAEQTLRVVWNCYRALLSVGDARAEPVLAAARQWLADVVSPFTDDEARKSLVEKVPWHKEIVLGEGAEAAEF